MELTANRRPFVYVPAAPPLRAELPRPPSAAALRRRPPPRLRRGRRPRRPGQGDRRRDRPRRRLPPRSRPAARRGPPPRSPSWCRRDDAGAGSRTSAGSSSATVSPPLRGLRRRQTDRDDVADVVDRPFRGVEGADPVPRPPLPGRHVRWARLWPIRPAGGSRGIPHETSSQPTRSPSSTRLALMPSCSWPCPAGVRWGIHLAAEHPDRVLGFVSIASTTPLIPDHPERRRCRSTNLSTHRRMGEVEQPLLGAATLPASSSSSWTDVHRIALDQADRGRHRVGPRIAPITLADTYRGIQLTDPQWFRDACSRVSCPVLVIHGDEDQSDRTPGASPWQRPPMAGC